jgi:hypothetical protein
VHIRLRRDQGASARVRRQVTENQIQLGERRKFNFEVMHFVSVTRGG